MSWYLRSELYSIFEMCYFVCYLFQVYFLVICIQNPDDPVSCLFCFIMWSIMLPFNAFLVAFLYSNHFQFPPQLRPAAEWAVAVIRIIIKSTILTAAPASPSHTLLIWQICVCSSVAQQRSNNGLLVVLKLQIMILGASLRQVRI